MKFSKVLAVFLSVIMVFSCFAFSVNAQQKTAVSIADGTQALIGLFEYGEGPETDGHSIDYRYFSPAGEDDDTKYPLVVWIHGMGDGAYDGKQIEKNDFSKWASAEFQSRFPAGGAYLLAPRSPEEKGLFWPDEIISSLRAAIDDFVAKNENVDTSRIYIGGYSMGGKMTLKMAVAYPEMFAAAMPICPAWVPGEEATALISDIPVWLVSSPADPLVNYFAWVMPAWENIVSQSEVAADCRFSTLSLACYPDGKLTSSNHHAWYAVANDMFSSENGAYPKMKTVDGNGEKVELTYPDGMISWLSAFSSDYDGAPATDGGNSQAREEYETKISFDMLSLLLRNLVNYIISCIKG